MKVLAIGKKHDRELKDAIEGYQQRLRAPFNVDWVLLPYSSRQGAEARQEESERLISHIKAADFVILLDERGKQLTSPAFSETLSNYGNIVIVIGGAYGVDDDLRRRADLTVSLSAMVFPHQLVRLILVEQIYRAQCIYQGHPYHHS